MFDKRPAIFEKRKDGAAGSLDTVNHDPESTNPKYDVDVQPAAHVTDAVFGELDEGGPNYRNVGAWGGFILMTKANLGLGVLALPEVFAVLGLVPGIIVIIVIQSIIAYCGVVIGTFKLNHPQVYSLADSGRVMGGRIGGEFLYGVFQLFMIFIIGSAISGLSTALNAVSAHGACTAVFVAVAAIAGMLVGSIRTLGQVTWIGWGGIISIMAAIITLTIAVGVQGRPYGAPPIPEPWDKDFRVFASPTFAQAMSAINSIVFSYGATPMYFGIVSEMRNPRTYARSMVASVFFLTVVYLVIGSVVYAYAGKDIASPALGTAGHVMKKVCYGLAIPGLLASLTIFSHLAGKHIFVRVLHGSYHLNHSTVRHWVTWLSCVVGSVLIGYIIASAIPIFGSLIGFIGALICPMVCIIPYTCMWVYDNWMYTTEPKTGRRRAMLYVNIGLFFIGWFLLGAGTYGSVLDLIAASKKNKGTPWSCADNSV